MYSQGSLIPNSVTMNPNPPAIVQAAFDEERALAQVRDAMGRRNVAKSEYVDAILDIGCVLLKARSALPDDVTRHGNRTYSQEFLRFIERCGLTKITAMQYMSFARDPKKLVHRRDHTAQQSRKAYYRSRTLQEVLDMLRAADTIEEAIKTIQEELNEKPA